MKRFFYTSLGLHSLFFGGVIIFASIAAKPRMSYYAVDLLSSGVPAPTAPPVEAPPTPEPVKAAVREAPPPPEAIKMPTKKAHPKPTPPVAKPSPPKPKHSAAFEAAMKSLQQEGPARTTPAMTGLATAGVVGEAGPTFPYPWYLKTIADKLDKQWKPPKEFASDTVCMVAFSISRDGQISDSMVEKASGDSLFDQLAMRAVLYSNPLPPLPAGYGEQHLRVHMKFVGKRS